MDIIGGGNILLATWTENIAHICNLDRKNIILSLGGEGQKQTKNKG